MNTTTEHLPAQPAPAAQIVQLAEWAKSRGVKLVTARRWAARGELPGAYLSGRAWLLPLDVPTPRAQNIRRMRL